ncbi:MAG: single-stranded-DNA-specific exonuclease RecJ [Lachnospiraceae bacterium]
MDKRWVVLNKKFDFNEKAAKFHIDPVTARLIRNRDIIADEQIEAYLNAGVEQLGDPQQMKDMERATELIREKIRQQKKIRIIGDYDIDGVVSTYILVTGLKQLGALADTLLPDRVADGYGISLSMVEQAVQDGIDTIITCDNGIAAFEEIELAKDAGMTVVVTDHHEVPQLAGEDRLVAADAIVNPKQSACGYPFKALCGAVVAYKLIVNLYRAAGLPAAAHEEFLEFAAIATVGDVMDLTGENRILVKEGLKRLRYTQNAGLKALLAVNELEDRQISAYHIGFIIGPCINASGRIDTARRSLELFTETDVTKAMDLAHILLELNVSRKELTAKGLAQAVELLDKKQELEKVLVVYLPDTHESLAGIIAGRLREKYYRPVIVLTKSKEAVKGSGRSIEAYSMYQALAECAQYFIKFGGHPMAAGMSLEERDIEALRQELNDRCSLTPEELMPKVTIDMLLPFAYITEKLVDEFSVLEPFGKGNTKPVFAQKNVRVTQSKVLGKHRNLVKMYVTDASQKSLPAVYFGDVPAFLAHLEEQQVSSITYYPSINEFRGQKTLELVITDYM